MTGLKMDIGDIVGVKGMCSAPKGGRFLSGSTRRPCSARPCCPLPEKFHGLTDLETRYRQRYVDPIVNPEVRRTFEIRSRFISYIRRFLDDRGYMEVETRCSTPSPVALQPVPSSPITIP